MEAPSPFERKCPNCRTKIQKMDGSYLYLRNAIIRIDLKTHCCFAKCPRCKVWIGVPLKYGN